MVLQFACCKQTRNQVQTEPETSHHASGLLLPSESGHQIQFFSRSLIFLLQARLCGLLRFCIKVARRLLFFPPLNGAANGCEKKKKCR